MAIIQENILAVITDYGDAFEGISGRNEPLKKKNNSGGHLEDRLPKNLKFYCT